MVEGNGLENRRAGNGTEGSNPSLSARFYIKIPSNWGFVLLNVNLLEVTPASAAPTAATTRRQESRKQEIDNSIRQNRDDEPDNCV